MNSSDAISRHSPFALDDSDAYHRWRDAKLEGYPDSLAGVVVEIGDPRHLTEAEHARMLAAIRKTNMVVYAGNSGNDPDKAIPRSLGERFGLQRLDANYLSDDDGITSLTVNPEGEHPGYIPYTNRAIHWHTDGYYNLPERQIHGLLLHCVESAAAGGENGLLDHEIAYIRLREENPDHIRALMRPDAMTIPPGKDAEGGERGAAVGPVFSVDTVSGALHMRYTARKRNIEWSGDPQVQAAVTALERLLESDLPQLYHGRLEPGMGLICNNVLHDRSGFEDSGEAHRRLLYRARYFDRVAVTGLADTWPVG